MNGSAWRVEASETGPEFVITDAEEIVAELKSVAVGTGARLEVFAELAAWHLFIRTRQNRSNG
jgi:hypothetical protein